MRFDIKEAPRPKPKLLIELSEEEMHALYAFFDSPIMAKAVKARLSDGPNRTAIDFLDNLHETATNW